jgi:hypothetical protein
MSSNAVKPRVAICMSGLLRTYKRTHAPFVGNLLKANPAFDFDVFIHTTDTMETSAPRYWKRGAGAANLKTEDYIDDVMKLYNPVNLRMDPAKNLEVSDLIRSLNVGPSARDEQSPLRMFRGIKLSNELKKQHEQDSGFVYDYVMRMRTDFEITKPITLPSKLQPNTVYIPDFGHFGGWNDQFAFGTSAVMDVYSEMFDNVHRILTVGKLGYNPEQMLKAHLYDNRIDVKQVPVNYFLRRMDGSIFDCRSIEPNYRARGIFTDYTPCFDPKVVKSITPP